MTAERLRAAAALMRLRADNSATALVGPLTWTTNFDGDDSLTFQHYQSWHPAAALAVADWLDVVALRVDSPHQHRTEWMSVMDCANEVANAYLDRVRDEA